MRSSALKIIKSGLPAKPWILVVDDDPLIRELLCQQLAAAFLCETMEADSARQAKQMLEQQEYRLVVCDLQMGAESGLEVFEYLKTHRKNIFFVLFTGAAESVRSPEFSHLITISKSNIGELIDTIAYLGFPRASGTIQNRFHAL